MNRSIEAGMAAGVGAVGFAAAVCLFPLAGNSTDTARNNAVLRCEQQLDMHQQEKEYIPGACMNFTFPEVSGPHVRPYGNALTAAVEVRAAYIGPTEYALPAASDFHDANFITSTEEARRQDDRWGWVVVVSGAATIAAMVGLEVYEYPLRKSSKRMFKQLEEMNVSFQPGRITHDTR